MYQPAVKRLFDHLQPSQVPNVASLLAQALNDRDEWAAFLQDLHDVFPAMEFKVKFVQETDEHIDVSVKAKGEWVPIELAGTGVLQATQILSYIHSFDPAIIVLDEPDSHLHPNNQRLMCALLRRIAEERETQVLLEAAPVGYGWRQGRPSQR